MFPTMLLGGFSIFFVTVLLLCLGGWVYSIYAILIVKRNRLEEARAGIDVQLTKRHDLIPNLLTIARKYMSHEQELLRKLQN